MYVSRDKEEAVAPETTGRCTQIPWSTTRHIFATFHNTRGMHFHRIQWLHVQILEVVNPVVKYRTQSKTMGSKISGVAIVLKDFLQALDTYGIPHVSENQIRQHIRKRSDYQTHMKQYFLRKGYKSNRWIPSSTKCKTCICIPRTDVPDTFFESLSDNSEKCLAYYI